MAEPSQTYDVVIAGAGPAGLAAGLFTARYALRTLILDRGKSMLKQCAYLDNFLGFPGGIDVSEFLALAQAHALEAGCAIERRRVIALRAASRPDEGRFVVETATGAAIGARNFIAATGAEADYLQPLHVPGLLDDEGELRREAVDAHGRTPLAGLYVAGPLAGVENQALISAGQAAQLALGLIRDDRQQREGYWDTLARHVDWQIKHGTCESERWAKRVRDYFAATAPGASPDAGASAANERAREGEPAVSSRALIERWIVTKRAQQLQPLEIERRRQRGRRMRAELLQSAREGRACVSRTP